MKNRDRNYCFNLHNYTPEQEAHWIELVNQSCVKKAIIAKELGKNGDSPHLQGYLEFHNAKTWNATMKWLGGKENVSDLSQRRQTAHEAWTYCLKEDNILIMIGEAPEEEYSTQEGAWVRIQRMVLNGATWLEICDEFPNVAIHMGSAIQRYKVELDLQSADWRDVHVTYVGGKTGTGKTKAICQAYGYPNVYRVTDYENPFDSYNGQEVIVFEEFRMGRKPKIAFAQMLNYIDGHPIQLPCRYSNRLLKATRIFLVSNWTLDEQYPWVQEDYPEDWNAFLRRLHHPKRGDVDSIWLETPEDGQRFKDSLTFDIEWDKSQEEE